MANPDWLDRHFDHRCALSWHQALTQEPRLAKQEPTVSQRVRTDAYGDPLPPGALARMGTLRDYIWDASSRIVFSADGRFVTASSMFIRFPLRLWDPASGRVVREFKELDRLGMGAGLVAISPDGTRIGAAGDESVWVGNIDTGQPIRVFSGFKYIVGVAFSPDGNVLLVDDFGTLLFCDIATGKPTHWPSLAGTEPIAFTHYFDVVGLGRSRGAAVLRFGVSGHEIRGRHQWGRYLDFWSPTAMSPDRRMLAVKESRDNTIRLFPSAPVRAP